MKYVRVDKSPEAVSPHEAVVVYPTFKEEIEKTRGRSGKTKLTTANYLRAIFVEIGFNHDPSFNAYTSIDVASFTGRAYSDDNDLSNILIEILNKGCPEVIEKRIEKQLQDIPRTTEVVYFVAKDLTGSRAFTRQGLQMIDLKEAQKILAPLKEKKKPTPKKQKTVV